MSNDEIVSPDATVALPPAEKLQLAYRGTGGDLFFIVIKNVFLTLVTLGIYTPWARTVKRQFLWRQIDIGGQRLDYTGTGRELFIGYLKVIVGYLILFGLPQLIARSWPVAGGLLKFVGFLFIATLLPFAIYWSRRYLLGRTRWRGIRFGLVGDARPFAKIFLKGVLLTIVTLGLYGPVLNNRLYSYLMRNTRYGNAAFSYDGPDGEAFKIAIKGFFLTLLTGGIYYFWYAAKLQRFRLSHTHFGGATGAFELTGGLLFKLMLVNLFGNALSLGLAFPWTTTYTLRLILERLTFVGSIDFAQITQQPPSGDAAGDMLAGALGVELGRVNERAMLSAWRGQFMDGQTASLHELTLTVEGEALVGRAAADPSTATDATTGAATGSSATERLRWPTQAVRSQALDHDHVVLTCAASPDATVTTSAADVALHLGGGHASNLLRRRPRWQALLAYGLGAVSVAALIYTNLDPLARVLARRIPPSFEAQLGQGLGSLLLKNACETPAAAAVLTALADRLGDGAPALHVLDTDMVNAFTLPGGVVVVTRGLLDEAASPDELAGVLAHELEHVKQRHVMIHVVRSSLLTMAWQATLGDYSGMFVIDPKTAMDIANLKFSRDAEREADVGARQRLDAAGISRAGFRQFFDRMKAKTDAVPAWLSNHPASAERASAIGDDLGAVVRTPALSPQDWQTLRTGCTNSSGSTKTKH